MADLFVNERGVVILEGDLDDTRTVATKLDALYATIEKTITRHEARVCPDQGHDCAICELAAAYRKFRAP
jgi:hypothetical protein